MATCDAHPLKRMIEARKNGVPEGIYSACSANALVIEAAMEKAQGCDGPVLVEATANQVNQYGGYTGMQPAAFRDMVFSIADKTGLSRDRVILGGDHLGPLTWKDLAGEKAMSEAEELVRQFVLAGYTKIHIDTSMRLGDDDKTAGPDIEIIAERGAVLAGTAEEAFRELRGTDAGALHPVYVIGSEVPVPGGSSVEDEGLHVTEARDFEDTVEAFRDAFIKHELREAWEHVVAVVVQPGVEFGDEAIHEYYREAAKELRAALKKYPDLVFEGHSTDYQTAFHLKQMVEDGFAVLKVGPALTFALREGLFALGGIEEEIFLSGADFYPSDIVQVLDDAMVRDPSSWKNHYRGSGQKIKLARKYSLSDRCRYYLPADEVRESIRSLIRNLASMDVPLTLISQYMPIQYEKIRRGVLKSDPESLLKDRVINCIDDYVYATLQSGICRCGCSTDACK